MHRFFFYATFGFVVTSSVEMAGVLLARTVGGRLLVGWVVGTVTSMAGIVASYVWDLPTGAAVVCAFGLCLVLCAGLRRVVMRV